MDFTMEKWTRILATVFIANIIFCSILYYTDFELYRDLVKEDGFIEYTTAFTLLLCSILLSYRLIILRNTKNTKWMVFNIFLIVGLFFGFGEEISWGQRIFSIESNDFFLRNNIQEETNFHNLLVGDVKINKIIFSNIIPLVVGLYFLFSLILYKRSSFIRKIVDAFGVQIPKVKHTLILLAITIVVMIVPDNDKWELWECLFPLIFLLVFLEPFNSSEKLFPSVEHK
jgi:hypothetical protein